MNARLRSLKALKLAALSFMAFSSAHAQLGSEVWVRRYSNSVDADDRARKVVTDNAGNVIVAGTSYDGINIPALVIIKCSAAGAPLWTNRYSYTGPGIGGIGVGGLNVDGSGNVVVTGSQYTGYDSGNDFVTIKYSAAGMPLWTNYYNGPGNGDDIPFASAVDGSGNVVVTGYSHGSNGDLDYATIKYSSAGAPLWTNRYNGVSNGDDRPFAVAADGNGNIIVTGSSGTNFGTHGYTTIKYSSVGVPLWTNLFDSVGEPTAMALDSSGNVFVTGYSFGGNNDYATVAYTSGGQPLWTNRYNGGNDDQASSIAVDSNGNVVVTGASDGSGLFREYATIKYSGAGVPLWTNRYHGPGTADDRPIAVAVDSKGDVLVTGNSASSDGLLDYATVKYSSPGDPLWTNRYDGPASDDRAQSMSVDSSGNVVVTGHSLGIGGSYDFATIKYSSSGTALWINRYTSVGNAYDAANAVAVDRSGNVVVTGYSYGIGSHGDYLTIKYSGAGVPLWTNRYEGPGNSEDRPIAMALDGSGNVFVTGYSSQSGGVNNSVTVAYSSAGALLWTNQYDGQVNALGVDGSGNVLVTGVSYSGGNTADYVTIKYSGAGVALWTNRYDGVGNSPLGYPAYDEATALAVDSNGNVFVTGYSMDSGAHYDYATLAYSSAGVPLWTNRYNGPDDNDDQPAAIAVDASGNSIVTGSSYSPISGWQYATIKYSSAGVPLWTNRYKGPFSVHDRAVAVAVDNSGTVFVTGYSTRNNDLNNYSTMAYSAAGTVLWTNRLMTFGSDYASAIAVDNIGHVFVTGSSYYGPSDYLTIAYTTAGVPVWTNRYNGPANGDDTVPSKSCLAIGPDGSVYVTGGSDGNYTTDTTPDFATVKYSSLRPLLAIEPDASGGFFVQFQGIPGNSYRLQRAPSVIGPWSDGGQQVASPSGLVQFHDSFPPVAQAFYRVQVE